MESKRSLPLIMLAMWETTARKQQSTPANTLVPDKQTCANSGSGFAIPKPQFCSQFGPFIDDLKQKRNDDAKTNGG
jgi:hypothetical protein